MWSWLEPQERRAVAADRWLARLHRDGSPDTMARYRRWRNRDPRNVGAIAQAEQVWRTMGKTSPEMAARIRGEGIAADTSTKHGAPALALAIAAALILMLGGALTLHLTRPKPKETGAATVFAADQSVRLLPLPDGSAVTLDRGAVVKVAYDARVRTVDLLRGRARFSVAHEVARRFVVLAGDTEVTAIGTVFEVTTADDQVSVTMLQGVVDIAHTRSPARTLPIRLVRGQMLQTGRGPDRVAAADPQAGQWGTRLDRLDDLPLGTLLARANQGGGKPILLADPALEPTHVEGQLPIHDTRALANQLAAALDLQLVEEPAGYILRPRH